MGYEVKANSILGLQFSVSFGDHPDINWETGWEGEIDEEEMEGDEIEQARVGQLIAYANTLGLDVTNTTDGEASTTDFVYVGLLLSGKPSELKETIKQLEQVMTPDVVQRCVDIMEKEPIEKFENYFDAVHSREPFIHVAYDKQW